MFKWNAEKEKALKELLKTEGQQDTADALGCHKATVKRAIKRLKIKYKKKTKLNYKLRRTWPDDFTQEQKEVLVGSLLGDGMISNHDAFRIKQCGYRREYIEYMSELFSPYMTGNIYDCTAMLNGKAHVASTCYTHKAPRFAALRKKWYPNNTKIVPRDIRLTPLMCAHWHVQDG